jgi:hypothetical protein
MLLEAAWVDEGVALTGDYNYDTVDVEFKPGTNLKY